MMTARERAADVVLSCEGWKDLATKIEVAILAHAIAVGEEDAAIAEGHLCGCGDHGTEIARRIRKRMVQ